MKINGELEAGRHVKAARDSGSTWQWCMPMVQNLHESPLNFHSKTVQPRSLGTLIPPVNKKFFLLASIMLVGSALQSFARPSAGGGGNPTKPPSEVSK